MDEGSKQGKIDPDIMNNIFRGVHSLKGLAGMFGMTKLSEFAHHLENLLDSMRLGKVRISSEMLDILFEALETFNSLTDEISQMIESGEEQNIVDTSGLLEKIRVAASQKVEEDEQDISAIVDLDPMIIESLMEYERFRLKENIRLGNKVFRVYASFDLMSFDQNLADLTENLKGKGEVIGTLPSADSDDDSNIDFNIIMASDSPEDELKKTFETDNIKVFSASKSSSAAAAKPAAVAAEEKPDQPSSAEPEPEIKKKPPKTAKEPLTDGDMIVPGPPAAEAAKEAVKLSKKAAAQPEYPKEIQDVLKNEAKPRKPKDKKEPSGGEEATKMSSLRSVSQTVRVDIKKLDLLMNIVGELVLSKTKLTKISDQLKLQVGFTGLAVDLYKETRQLERQLDELQNGVMEVRMVQVRQVFDKLSRVVRKISRDAGKEINFEISGADTELDKLIIEELSDPLMHLIRNCIDHGIEFPQERAKNGKPEAGTIWVSAFQKGNHVIIEIRDDGAGLNTEKIAQIAVKKELVEEEKISELSVRDINNFIFLPGFSTKEKVTEISGRGVGMDVVKTNISNLSGMIDVQSEQGIGTVFTITLPITLAIIKALIIESNTKVYAIPLNAVIEILTISKDEILTIERREVIQLRGQTVPLMRLSDLFHLRSEQNYDQNRFFTIIVGLAQNKLGIIVDKMLDQQDIVIKPLGKVLSKIKGFAGATDLGNQQTILVLDIGALIEEALRQYQMEG